MCTHNFVFLKFYFFLFSYECLCAYMLSTMHVPSAFEIQKKPLDSLELEIWMVVPHVGAGKSQFSLHRQQVLFNYWATSPAPVFFALETICMFLSLTKFDSVSQVTIIFLTLVVPKDCDPLIECHLVITGFKTIIS